MFAQQFQELRLEHEMDLGLLSALGPSSHRSAHVPTIKHTYPSQMPPGNGPCPTSLDVLRNFLGENYQPRNRFNN